MNLVLIMKSRFDNSLNSLPINLKKSLQPLINNDFNGFISAKDMFDLKRITQFSTHELLLHLLPIAKVFSSPPISNFPVGAIVQGISNNIYMGGNFEIEHKGLLILYMLNKVRSPMLG